MIKTVSVQELCEQLETDFQTVLIDVRSPKEFAAGHVPQARNIPLGSMPIVQMLAEWSRESEGKSIYFICQSGGRSQQLLDELEEIGYRSAQCVAGGMIAWQALGLPIEGEEAGDPEAIRSSERRLCLLVGLVILLGCGLGFQVHPGFFAIPVAVSMELIFTGLTGWSGLGALFGKRKRTS
ncbi:MAG: rhodanese-like domain-containing protein [Nibricoccus sp.]